MQVYRFRIESNLPCHALYFDNFHKVFAQRDNRKVSDDKHVSSILLFKDEAVVVLKLEATLKGRIGRTRIGQTQITNRKNWPQSFKKGKTQSFTLMFQSQVLQPQTTSTTSVNKLTNEMHASLSEHGVAERK